MQFEQHEPGKRDPLPRPSIDTGMGLERLSAVLQGKHDNYDIDLMRTLIEASADETNVSADGEQAVSHRVISDHLRACSFLIADGVLPSNEGRGYVLRRIMRRAMRHAHLLGCQEPLMHRLVPVLVTQMGQAFNELSRAQLLISETFKLEEERFKQTLDRGLKLLEDETSKLGESQNLSGEVAFRLYDTFGFPVDLTEDILRGQGRSINISEFNKSMEQQRQLARQAWTGSGEAATDNVWFDVNDITGASEFLGYETDLAEGVIKSIIVNNKIVNKAEIGDEVALILNQTPFYGESGGQMGDTGNLISNEGSEIRVTDTQKKFGTLYVHYGTVFEKSLKVGDIVELQVDTLRRDRLRANHSATHLLHQALRSQLGDHVTQKGSLVAPNRLRFDISQPKPISPEDLSAVEDLVNERIGFNTPVETLLMSPDNAIQAGALALFGEKYGEEVRVVSMGGSVDVDDSINDEANFSVELCGGTHVNNTGDIGLFTIVSESGVSAGIRRIEALTGIDARRYFEEQTKLLNLTANVLKSSPADVPTRVSQVLEERRKLERELAEARRKLITNGNSSIETPHKEINGIKYIGRSLTDIPPRELKSMVDDLKSQLGSGIVAIIGVYDGKGSIVVGVTNDLIEQVSAVDLVRLGVDALGGKGGGGRPDMAQGGGPDVTMASNALTSIEEFINKNME
jgi:alanyl-tRNA synthetase